MNSGDAGAAGTPLSVDEAASAIGALLAGESGDSGADDADERRKPESDEAEAETPKGDEPEETKAEEESEPSGETEEAAQQPQKFRVKVGGEEVEVTQDELLKGYSREQDYTRKTMELAELRKAQEAEKAALVQRRDEYGNYLEAVREALSKPIYDPTEMETLRTGTPEQRAEWSARMAEESKRTSDLHAVLGHQQRITAEKQSEQAKADADRTREETAKLIDAIPEWKDKAKFQAGMKEVWEYGQFRGFTPDELHGARDHRIMLALKDAAAFRALQAKKPQVQAKVEAVKTVKPGAATAQPSNTTKFSRDREALAKDGRTETAAKVFRHILG